MMPKELGRMHVGMSIEAGKKYYMRAYPNLGLDKLHKVKVLAIRELGDGTKIISYRHSGITDEMQLADFERHMVKWTTQKLLYE